MRSLRFLLILVLAVSVSQLAVAKRFTSQYCEFELPSGWQCALEGAEWVCQSLNKDRQKEAIIILAAKIRGKQDSLEEYQSYLKKQKTFTIPGGKTQVSEPKLTKINEINKHRWVDSLHMASEVPGFYTRYLATVKADLGVAVTFSVAKDFYNAYKKIFDKIIASLRVFRQRKVDLSNVNLPSGDKSLIDSDSFIPDFNKKHDVSQGRRGGKGGGAAAAGMAFVVFLIIGGGAYMVMKKKKGKKKKGKKKKS